MNPVITLIKPINFKTGLRKEELELLKDDLLIYSDPKFMASIKKGIGESEIGDTVKCKDSHDVKKLFESL